MNDKIGMMIIFTTAREYSNDAALGENIQMENKQLYLNNHPPWGILTIKPP